MCLSARPVVLTLTAALVHAQIAEMDMIRNKIFQLEQSHNAMKAKYEDEIQRLKYELEQRGGSTQGGAVGPAQAPPPSIGHGPANLFQGIMAGGAQGGPQLAPPQQDQQAQPGLQMHAPPAPGFTPQGPPQHPFQYGQPQQAPAGINGYGQPAQTASPGPEYDVEKMPPHFKRQGHEWHAIFNPKAERRLDVDLVHTLAHDSVVCCVRFSQDGRFVATGCNRSAQIFDVESGQRVCKLEDGQATAEGDLYIRSVCFSPDGRYLATGAEDKVIRIWDIHAQTIRHAFSGHEQDIYSLDFASDGRHIASGSGDRSIRIWDIVGEQAILTMTLEDGVTTVAISPDNRLVAAGSLDKSVRIWDIKTGTLIERAEGETGHRDSVYSVAFSPDGRQLVSGSLDKTIKMWELGAANYMNMNRSQTKAGKCVRTFEGHKDFVLSVALTPDGAWVMSGSKDRGVQFWDPATGQAQLMLQGHKNSGEQKMWSTEVVIANQITVISVAPSPRGGLFATGSGDQKARIWRYDPFRG
ncbi:hypothetical protein MRB53_037972 [Persea americana]|nr:hypothetical protein MRB53_037972 [Persea americana]